MKHSMQDNTFEVLSSPFFSNQNSGRRKLCSTKVSKKGHSILKGKRIKVFNKVTKSKETSVESGHVKEEYTDTEKYGRDDNCVNCICDVARAVIDLREIVLKKNDLLSRIGAYDCNRYQDIGNEIVITSNGTASLPRYGRELEETKGRKYVSPEDVEDTLKRGIYSENEHEILALPGFNLNIPCNYEGEDFMWVMSISRPNYTWVRSDDLPVSGYLQKTGMLELYEIDAKDTGNYSCIVNYIDAENEEPVLRVYSHKIQVVTLPRYTLRGGIRYKVKICDNGEVDAMAGYLPQQLNDMLCKNEICYLYILTPHCRRQNMFITAILVPANIAKIIPVGLSVCGIRCHKAVQDKVTLLLSRNLKSLLEKPIVFRLPHNQERLEPIRKDNKTREKNKRGRSKKYKATESPGEVGLLIGCPAGYSLQETHCLPCEVGFYSEDGSSYCKKCPAGSHQPNTGSRSCRTCTNPFAEGCHDMIWNFSPIASMIMVAICAVTLISLILLLIVFCVKKYRKNVCFKAEETNLPCEKCDDEDVTQPLIRSSRDSSADEDLSEHEFKHKQQKTAKKRIRKQGEERKSERGFILVDQNELRNSNDKDGKRRQERKIIGFRYVPITCLESYRSHRGYCENYLAKPSSRKKPPVPFPDFDRNTQRI